jgi:hypothetical protein
MRSYGQKQQNGFSQIDNGQKRPLSSDSNLMNSFGLRYLNAEQRQTNAQTGSMYMKGFCFEQHLIKKLNAVKACFS